MGGFDFGSLIQAVAPSVIGAFSAAQKPDYTGRELDIQQQQFAQNMALDREKMAQALMIAQMNAAAGSAGAGSAVAAARIKAATDEKAIRQQALQALMEGRLKQADLANPEQINSANQFKANKASETGQTGLSAFMALADKLQAPLLRRG